MIAEFALTGRVAARVGVNVEFLLVRGQSNAGFFVNPFGNVAEDLTQKFFIYVRLIGERKVEVFRKPIGFEEALFEAGSTLEYPVFGKGFVLVNSGKNPAKHKVLFNDGGVEAQS